MRFLPFLRTLAIATGLLAWTASGFAARIPMYAMYNATYNDWFFTVSTVDRATALSTYGYTDYGIAFYVEDRGSYGAAPFYRFFYGVPLVDHFYTIDPAEVSFVLSFGYAAEGNEGYLYPSPTTNAVPVYRLSKYNGANGDLAHYYTTNWSQAVNLTYQGWGLDRQAGYAFTTPNLVKPPRQVHATQLTASCPDKYCVKLYGFNVSQNAYVQARSNNSSGPVVATFNSFTRGSSGDATTLELTFTDPYLRGLLGNEPGLWFQIVQPETPPQASEAFNVVRDSDHNVLGATDIVDGSRIAGWVCSSSNFARGLLLRIRLGSDSGTDYITGTANLPRPDVAFLCGGYANHGFDIPWPARWKTGAVREIYAVADLQTGKRYPNVLVQGTPRIATIPYSAFDAAFSSQVVPTLVPVGGSFPVEITMLNVANYTWTVGSRIALNSLQGATWTPTSVPVQASTGPDAAATFRFNVKAPIASGIYNFQWRMWNGSALFGAATPLVQIRVVAPPTVQPTFVFPEYFE